MKKRAQTPRVDFVKQYCFVSGMGWRSGVTDDGRGGRASQNAKKRLSAETPAPADPADGPHRVLTDAT